MPSKSKKFKPGYLPERKTHLRLVDNYDFYNSSKWRKTSIAYRQAHPLCELYCKENNIVGPADVCDHKERLQIILKEGRDPYDWNELQSGCNKCHNKKSGLESNINRDTP